MARNILKSIEMLKYRTQLYLKVKTILTRTVEPVRHSPVLCAYETIKYACLAYCSVFTFVSLVGFPASVNGKSMQPTLNPGHGGRDWVWVNCRKKDKLERGDLLVYTSPKDPEEFLIKRLIAMEGDVIRTEGRYSKPVVRIPPGQLWVEGDNWGNSIDSNKYGTVPKGLVDGVATHIVWPPSRVQGLCQPVPDFLRPGRVTKAEQRLGRSNRSVLHYWKIIFYFIKS